MRSSTILLCLILLFGISYSANGFNVMDYLKANETISSVTYENFTINGTQYSILKIKNDETFLLSGGNLIQDQPSIDNAVHSYYSSKYFPTQSEISGLKSLLDAYNASRNDGNKFPKKEEYSCREVIFVDGRVKSGNNPVACKPDLNNCNYSAMFLYSYLSAVSGIPPVGSWTDLLQPIKDFGLSSYSTEYILANASKKLGASTESTIYDDLKYIKDSIPTLRTNAQKMEESQFGWYWKASSNAWIIDSKHWALCPPIDLDTSILDKIEINVTALMSKTNPIINYNSVSTKIFTNTNSRLDTYSKETNATRYSNKYLPLASEAAPVITFAQSTTSKVQNSTLASDLANLKSLHTKINNSINNREFSTIESDLATYSLLIPKVNSSATYVYAIYGDSLSAKNKLDSLVFIMDSRDFDPLSKPEADSIKNQTIALDSKFKDGLNATEYLDLAKNYSELGSQAQTLLRKTRANPGSVMFLSFRNFARKVNNGLASFIVSANIMPLDEVPEKKASTFGAFSLISLFSLGAASFLFFFGMLVMRHNERRHIKHALIVLFVISMLSLTAFSAFLFVYLDKTSSQADFEEFISEMNARNGTAIFVDATSAPIMAKDPMKACANEIAKKIAADNKSATVYAVDSTGCTRQMFSAPGSELKSISRSECSSAMEDAKVSIYMNYSDTVTTPKFSIIYTNRADIAADYYYYNFCPLSEIFG